MRNTSYMPSTTQGIGAMLTAFAANRGVRAADLRRIEQLVFEHHAALEKAFYEYHPQ